MKTITLISCMLISFQLFSQRIEPEKGDNVIILHNDLKADSNFILCSKHFALKRYSFETRDKELSQITTSPKSFDKLNQYKLTILCWDSTIILKCSLGIMYGANQIWTEWKYSNSSFNDAYNKAYNKFFPNIVELKRSIANCKVEYKFVGNSQVKHQQDSISQAGVLKEIKIQDEFIYIKNCLNKCHKQYKAGTTLFVAGLILNSIGFIAKDTETIISPLSIIGGGLMLVGGIIQIDSHKWIGRVPLEPEEKD